MNHDMLQTKKNTYLYFSLIFWLNFSIEQMYVITQSKRNSTLTKTHFKPLSIV